MAKVNNADLRHKRPAGVARVREGEPMEVTVRERVIARIVLEADRQAAARRWLKALRKSPRVGDVMSPSGEAWRHRP